MLKNLVKDLLLPFYESLCRFFTEVFNLRTDYHYVVFVARRCSILAEIFFQVLTDGAGLPLPGNYLTDSAMLSLVPQLADTYRRNGRFPAILIVDDIVIYGKSLTAFLDELEELLWLELREDGYTREDIVAALRRAIRIHAFARNNQPLLLASRYQSNFTVMQTLEPRQWRDLSNRISRLILVSGRINSSFIVGSRLPRVQTEWPALYAAGFSRVTTTYDAFPQTMFCRTVPLSGAPCLIYTVRILPSSVDGALVAAPFVFFPDMTDEAMEALTQNILEQLRPQFGRTPLDPGGSWARCPRTRAEALNLLLSVSLLQEFCRLTGFLPDYNGRLKLQMNFATALNGEAKAFIDHLMDPTVNLLSMSQMDQLLLRAVCVAGAFVPPGYYWAGEVPSCRGEEALKRQVEDFAYETGMSNYAQSYWQTQMYQERKPSEREETSDHFTTVAVMMGQLSDICRERYPLSQAVSWVLQMVDAGILSIAVRTFARGDGTYVAQCVKTGEQSQFIMPKRLREFIPVLILIQRKARILNRDFYDEFTRFAQVNESFDRRRQDLLEFLDGLNRSGQKLEDWDFDLVTLPDSSSENWMSEAGAALRSMQRQQWYMDEYIDSMRAE